MFRVTGRVEYKMAQSLKSWKTTEGTHAGGENDANHKAFNDG
jgi:hypothetical protein